MTTIVTLARDQAHAQQIVHRLQQEGGLLDSEISVLLPGESRDQDYGQIEDFLTEGGAPSSTRTHGLTAGAIGAAVGASAVVLPGLGGFLAAGAAATVFGAAIGGLAGGAIAALAGVGIPDSTVEQYRQRVREGAYLLAAQSESAQRVAEARRIIHEEGGELIHETPQEGPNP